MVKLQEYFVRKRRKFGSIPYEYRGVLLRVPKKCHNKIDAFVGVDLTVQSLVISEFNGGHTITLILVTKRVPQKSVQDVLNQLMIK